MNYKILLIALLSFSTIAPMGKNVANEGFTKLADATQGVAGSINNGADAVNNIASNMPNAGVNAAEKIGKTASTIFGLSMLWNAGAAVKSYVWPSRSDKIATMDVNATYERLNARQNFKDCLKKNVNCKRDDMGIPYECQLPAAEYAFEAGDTEVENMARTYNKFFPRKS